MARELRLAGRLLLFFDVAVPISVLVALSAAAELGWMLDAGAADEATPDEGGRVWLMH
jgi:hypothetical protein